MDLWQTVLAELRTQVTQSTFDTWLADTAAARIGSQLTVFCSNAFAKDWLESRLLARIRRVVDDVAGQPLDINFAINKFPPQRNPVPTKAGEIFVEIIKLPTEPFLKVSKYSLWFWQSLMGNIAFSTYLMLRSRDHYMDKFWGKRHRLSVELIAEILQVNRQAITGVQRLRNGVKRWTPGAFDAINEHQVGKIDSARTGRSTIYHARILNTLPLLTPAQVATLPPIVQEHHTGYLKKFDVDRVRWEQLTMANLVHSF
jgi:hypothetical protein